MPRHNHTRRGRQLQQPGGESALRKATSRNPRNQSCPTCGARNRLTPADVRRGYQCDSCARVTEGAW